jgi:GTPase Era involved in 16S rRNA processing
MKRLKKYISNGKNIYIPFIGESSSGKSTILNSLLGYKLFPESQSECTTRGIIIKYGEEVELHEVKLYSENNFYVFEEGMLLSKTAEKVQEFLNCLNYQYGKDESKYFYLVKTPIKFFDDYKFGEVLKKNVLLVDLPGSDTSNNKFNEHDKTERTVYEKLLEISSSFIFINRGRGITSIENKKILNQAYNTVIDNSSLGNKFIENCLFVINMFEKLEEKEKDILGIKKDLYTILFNDDQQKEKNNNFDLINSSLFDAKSYMEYLKIYNKIGNREIIFKIIKEEFITKKKKKFY